MKVKKGILLAGGNATRLYPMTLSTSKHLLPIWNKPMIYYPLSNFLLAGINEILIISSSEYINNYKKLFGNGEGLGINIKYKTQLKPTGIPQAFLIGEKFINNDPVALNLGDHIFFGKDIDFKISNQIKSFSKTTIFTYKTPKFKNYGVIEYDKSNKPKRVIEKPKKSISKEIVCGFYIFDKNVSTNAKKLVKSKRGEYEISDLINIYIKKDIINIEKINHKNNYWIDAGNPEKIFEASKLIRNIESNKKNFIGSVEINSFKSGLINYKDLKDIFKIYEKKPYGNYLKNFLNSVKKLKYQHT